MAGGTSVSHIARWDGVQWSPVGDGFDRNVLCLHVHDGLLYAGGVFNFSGTEAIARVAAWDGISWESLDQGVNGFVPALASHNGDLVVGGTFTDASGTAINRVASWDGSTWTGFGDGIDNSVKALHSYNGKLMVGGEFDKAGGVWTDDLAAWDGTKWIVPVGFAGPGSVSARIEEFGTYNGKIIAVGRFTKAGSKKISRVAILNGQTWIRFSNPSPSGPVNTLIEFENDLIVGGSFQSIGGLNLVRNIARWNGTAWTFMASGQTVNGTVHDLVIHQGDLFMAGEFTEIAGNPVNRIARWDGAAWQTIGQGMNGNVFALESYTGNLYAGGVFDSTDGDAIAYLACWDGASWSAVGSGVDGEVRDLQVIDGELHVGGDFLSAGGVPASRVAAWDGSSWSTYGSGFNGLVRTLTHYNGALFAGGDFTEADSLPAVSIARWNGSAWVDIDPGLDSSVHMLAVIAPLGVEALVVSGPFEESHGKVADRLALWYDDFATSTPELGHHSTLPLVRMGVSRPNPFNPRMMIPFELGARTRVLLNIYDIQGRLVRTLVEEELSTGQYEAMWEGRNSGGTLVGSGAYFLRLETQEGNEVRRITLVR